MYNLFDKALDLAAAVWGFVAMCAALPPVASHAAGGTLTIVKDR